MFDDRLLEPTEHLCKLGNLDNEPESILSASSLCLDPNLGKRFLKDVEGHDKLLAGDKHLSPFLGDRFSGRGEFCKMICQEAKGE